MGNRTRSLRRAGRCVPSCICSPLSRHSRSHRAADHDGSTSHRLTATWIGITTRCCLTPTLVYCVTRCRAGGSSQVEESQDGQSAQGERISRFAASDEGGQSFTYQLWYWVRWLNLAGADVRAAQRWLDCPGKGKGSQIAHSASSCDEPGRSI